MRAHYSFDGHDAGFHRKLGEAGLLFPAWPRHMGGRDAGVYAVHAALQVPELSLPQVSALPIGLMEFLLAEVNRISGLAVAPAALEEAAEQPIARAAHVLAREFGWTPQQIGELTLGQILLHLQMLREEGGRHG